MNHFITNINDDDTSKPHAAHAALRVLIVVHHFLLHSRGYVLNIDPCASEVTSPETQGTVLRRGGQHSAGGIPGDSPHVGLGGALNGLRGHILQRAVFLPVQLVNLRSMLQRGVMR